MYYATFVATKGRVYFKKNGVFKLGLTNRKRFKSKAQAKKVVNAWRTKTGKKFRYRIHPFTAEKKPVPTRFATTDMMLYGGLAVGALILFKFLR